MHPAIYSIKKIDYAYHDMQNIKEVVFILCSFYMLSIYLEEKIDPF